jgi:hypothetical protein
MLLLVLLLLLLPLCFRCPYDTMTQTMGASNLTNASSHPATIPSQHKHAVDAAAAAIQQMPV